VPRAFIAGADARVRLGVALLLAKTRGFEVVGEAAERMEMVPPDLVVMDIDLPGMSEAVDAGEIVQACPQASIVVLTTTAQAELVAYLDPEPDGEIVGRGDGLDDLLLSIQTLRSGEVLVYPP
jgi:DNA-binding NarL/FixJ family response regulator